MSRILFFDDRHLHVVRYAQRHMGQAEMLRDTLYADPCPDIFSNIPNVFFSDVLGKWLMLSYGMHLRAFYDVILLHESDDGLHWKPMDTTPFLDLKTRKYSHQLFELGQCGEYFVYCDERACTQERFKLLAVRRGSGGRLESCLFFSPDGLHWTDQHINWHPSPPDLGPLCIFFNNQRGTYIIATRPSMVDRRIALMETADWKSFSVPQVVLETDALDTPVCESYGLTVLPYDNYYLGLYWLFHPNAAQVTATPEGVSGKYFDGYVDAQVVSSNNGWYFKRALRDPVLPNGAPGQPDSGCIYPRGMRRASDGSILIDACVYPYEHGRWREFVRHPSPHATLVTYRIREDGFCYYQNTGGEAFLGSRALLYKGGPLTLNAMCPTGLLKVQITDRYGHPFEGYRFEDCTPFSEDQCHWQPLWKGRDAQALSGQVIRIEICFKTGRLFAIHGNLDLVLQPET